MRDLRPPRTPEDKRLKRLQLEAQRGEAPCRWNHSSWLGGGGWLLRTRRRAGGTRAAVSGASMVHASYRMCRCCPRTRRYEASAGQITPPHAPHDTCTGPARAAAAGHRGGRRGPSAGDVLPGSGPSQLKWFQLGSVVTASGGLPAGRAVENVARCLRLSPSTAASKATRDGAAARTDEKQSPLTCAETRCHPRQPPAAARLLHPRAADGAWQPRSDNPLRAGSERLGSFMRVASSTRLPRSKRLCR